MSVHRTHGLVVSPGFRILNTLHRWPATSGSRSAILWVLPFEKPQPFQALSSIWLSCPFTWFPSSSWLQRLSSGPLVSASSGFTFAGILDAGSNDVLGFQVIFLQRHPASRPCRSEVHFVLFTLWAFLESLQASSCFSFRCWEHQASFRSVPGQHVRALVLAGVTHALVGSFGSCLDQRCRNAWLSGTPADLACQVFNTTGSHKQP